MPLLLVAAIAAVWWPVVGFSFLNFDDDVYVTGNEHVRNGFSFEAVRWALTETHGGHWHPLTWLSHMLDCELFGLASGYHHLVNVLFHAANALLLFAFLASSTGNRGTALFAAAVFALHPMRLESVTWVAERKDVLSVFFGMLALLAYRRYGESRTPLRYGAVVLCFVLSLSSKPTLVTLPALLLLLDFWPLRRYRERRDLPPLLREKAPLVAISLASAIVTVLAQRSGDGLRQLAEIGLADRAAGALVGYSAYLGKLFLPTGFAVFYPRETYAPGIAAGAAVGLVAVTWWCASLGRRYPCVLVGWLWFLLALVPVIGLVTIGGQAFADRWSYFPHIGLLVAVAWGLRELAVDVRWRRALGAGAVVVVAALSAITVRELPHWKDSVAVFSHALDVTPKNFLAHTNLGTALLRLGRAEEAARHYEEAVRLHPTYPEALNNLGIVRARARRFAEAKELFERALELRSNFPNARHNLGVLQAELSSRPN